VGDGVGAGVSALTVVGCGPTELGTYAALSRGELRALVVALFCATVPGMNDPPQPANSSSAVPPAATIFGRGFIGIAVLIALSRSEIQVCCPF
jgi:hypothetical protein